jgi:hypothetical protein
MFLRSQSRQAKGLGIAEQAIPDPFYDIQEVGEAQLVKMSEGLALQSGQFHATVEQLVPLPVHC